MAMATTTRASATRVGRVVAPLATRTTRSVVAASSVVASAASPRLATVRRRASVVVASASASATKRDAAAPLAVVDAAPARLVDDDSTPRVVGRRRSGEPSRRKRRTTTTPPRRSFARSRPAASRRSRSRRSRTRSSRARGEDALALAAEEDPVGLFDGFLSAFLLIFFSEIGDKARSDSHRSPYDPIGVVNAVSLRTFSPVVSLRPGSLAFNPDTPRRLSTPLLTPMNSTPISSLCMERPKDVFHRRAPRAAAGQGDGVRGNVRRAGGHDRHLRRHRAGVSPRGRSPRGIRRVVVGRLPRRRAAPRVRHSGAFYLTLVPIRPRWRGERRFSRTFSPGRISPPRVPRFQRPPSTPFTSASDAFELHPDIIALYTTTLRPS